MALAPGGSRRRDGARVQARARARAVRPPQPVRRSAGRVAEASPGRPAPGLDELDQHAVAAPRVQERHGTFRTPAWRGVDQLDAVDAEPGQLLGQVRDLEADVVETLALVRQEAGDAGRVVGRL